jgi:hypothetical protein
MIIHIFLQVHLSGSYKTNHRHSIDRFQLELLLLKKMINLVYNK